MLTFKTTSDPNSQDIFRDKELIAYLFLNRPAPQISLCGGNGYLFISEVEQIMLHYRELEFKKKNTTRAIDSLDISVRLHRALTEAGIKTVYDIVSKPHPKDLGLGRKSEVEFEFIMHEQCGLVFENGSWKEIEK